MIVWGRHINNRFKWIANMCTLQICPLGISKLKFWFDFLSFFSFSCFSSELTLSVTCTGKLVHIHIESELDGFHWCRKWGLCHSEQTFFTCGRIYLMRYVVPLVDSFAATGCAPLLIMRYACAQTNNHNNFLSTSLFHTPHERHIEWENIVIPQMYQPYNQQIHTYQQSVPTATATQTNNHNSRHRMSYLIKSLTPASNYEARVQARNDHGWNKLSSTFHFSTRAEGKSIYNIEQKSFYSHVNFIIWLRFFLILIFSCSSLSKKWNGRARDILNFWFFSFLWYASSSRMASNTCR